MEQYGGLFQTPAYLLWLKPQLLLDGEIVAEGAPCPAGSQQKYTISIHSAAPDRQDSETGNSIVAGGMYCIASDYGTMSADNLLKSVDRMEALQRTVSEVSVYTDEAMGNLLDSIGKAYFARLDLYNTVISGQDNVSAARDFSVGMVGFNINVISSFGRPTELNETAIAMLPLGGVTAVLFFIVECILLLDYIDNVIQLWNMYHETGDVVYLQEAFIQLSVFVSMMVIIPQIKPQLEKFQKSLQETMSKLKKVPEYKEGVGACFIAGTLVLSASGFVPVETITAGDLVQSFDPQTQQVSLKEVEETFVRETTEFVHVTVGSERITTTPEHPFYVAKKGFVKAENFVRVIFSVR